MGDLVEVRVVDGHRFKAWRAAPAGASRGLVVIAPEIFGVNDHIRAVADDFAEQGYLTLAPQLFDRSEPDYEAGYEDTDIAAGRAIIEDISFEASLRDMKACIQYAGAGSAAAVVGYCWGGTIAWLAASGVDGLKCAVAYYGGGIPAHIESAPACPILLHFGEHDTHPSASDARRVAERYPEAVTHFYDAGHGFNCNQRSSWNPEAAALARTRTLEFLARYLG